MVIRYSLGSDKCLLEKLPLDPASSDMLDSNVVMHVLVHAVLRRNVAAEVSGFVA